MDAPTRCDRTLAVRPDAIVVEMGVPVAVAAACTWRPTAPPGPAVRRPPSCIAGTSVPAPRRAQAASPPESVDRDDVVVLGVLGDVSGEERAGGHDLLAALTQRVQGLPGQLVAQALAAERGSTSLCVITMTPSRTR